MIDRVYINEFRQFKDIEIKFNKNMNIFIGKNMAGKSTMLALLVHTAGLKDLESEITGKKFLAEFKNIIKGSSQYDTANRDAYRVKFRDHDPIYIVRVYFNYKGKENERLRILAEPWDSKDMQDFSLIDRPINNLKKRNKAPKAPFPSIYLGLSRLYPVGEAKNVELVEEHKMNQEEEQLYLQYRKIVLGDEHVSRIGTVTIKAAGKISPTIEGDHYGSLQNSAGQDNIGQILLAMLAFRRLHENSLNGGDDYKGGILCIDEFDATLHPSAQCKLLGLVNELSTEFKVQLFITTHNSRIMEDIVAIAKNSCPSLFLFDADPATKKITIEKDPSRQTIINNLTELRMNPFPLFTEDPEALWMLKQLIPHAGMHFTIESLKQGCGEVKKIFDVIRKYNVVAFLFDGDVDNIDYKDPTLIKLPLWSGDTPKGVDKKQFRNPECLLYGYLYSLPIDHKIWYDKEERAYDKSTILNLDFSTFAHEGGALREETKKWFKNNKEFFIAVRIIDRWKEDNPMEFKQFEDSYNNVRNCLLKSRMDNKSPQPNKT